MLAITRPHRPHPTKPKAHSFNSLKMAIEKTTTQTFRVSGCELDFSFNRLKVSDPANGEVISIEGMDWRKLQDALGDYYSSNASGSVGVEWFRNSVRFWDVDDLKALGAAVQGAIAEKEVTTKAEQ